MLLFGIENLQGQRTSLQQVCFFSLGRALFATLRLIPIAQFKLEPTKALLHTSQVDNPDHSFFKPISHLTIKTANFSKYVDGNYAEFPAEKMKKPNTFNRHPAWLRLKN